MSNITIQPNGSGSGTFSIASPNSNTSRTLTLPDTTGVLLNDASSLASGKLTGALPAIDGSALTGVGSTTYDAVGTYACLWWSGAGNQSPGATVAGSSLYPSNLYALSPHTGHSTVNGSASGTWRLMGQTGRYDGTVTLARADMYSSVFVRIS